MAFDAGNLALTFRNGILEAIPQGRVHFAGPAPQSLLRQVKKMELSAKILLALTGYHIWWIAFVAAAYLLPRRFGIPGVLIAHVLTAILICVLDVAWMIGKMDKPGYDPATGPDMDLIFTIGVLFRIVLINVILLPVAITGCFRRSHAAKAPPDVQVIPT